MAVPIFEGVESKFGLVLPKFATGIFFVKVVMVYQCHGRFSFVVEDLVVSH